jgi:rhodanese-related sulfurtransferase
VLVVCRSGRRSLEASNILAASGFRQVSNLEGGMLAWRQAESAAK